MMYRVAGILIAAVVAIVLAPVSRADPPPEADLIDAYPQAKGRYSVPGETYWQYFRTPDGRACGIAPNDGTSGCDAVPSDAPDGTNQTVVSGWTPGQYRYSNVPRFNRNVDVLPEGQKLVIRGTVCAVAPQSTVICKLTTGSHGFVLAQSYGILW